MDWDEKYQKGGAFWDKGAPVPAMKQYLERHAVRGLTFPKSSHLGFGHFAHHLQHI